MTTIGEVVSRIRNMFKAVKQDAFVTDRFIYSVVKKHAAWVLAREDTRMKIFGYIGITQKIDFIELIEVDKVQAGCRGIKTDCTIKRTKEKMPEFFQGYFGPLITNVTSISGSATNPSDEDDLQPTTPSDYANIVKSSSFKFNKTKYYWFLNSYLYFPNLEWDAVSAEGIGTGDFSTYGCCGDDETKKCSPRQEEIFNIPEKLFGEIEQPVLKEFGIMFSVPSDNVDDKINPLR